MKSIIQRVSESKVIVDDAEIASITSGLLVLIGIEDEDNQSDIDWIVGKIANLRIFNDPNGIMNLSIKDISGGVIVVSQFTLQAAIKKGNRPSYIKASKAEFAKPLYDQFIIALEIELSKKVQAGVFGADMKVFLINDGPVTISMDSKNKV